MKDVPKFIQRQPGSPRFKCEYEGCDMGFEFKHVLEIHVQRKHLDPKPKKKRSDAIVTSVLDDLLGFTDNDAAIKMPFACTMPGCGMRYSREWLLRRHMKSNAHQAGEITGADLLQSMDEVENQAVREMMDLNLKSDNIYETQEDESD
ncbi:hypothetical protein BGZ76_010939 [Entomortierella beljakovae]|nr:hypothetical protein BGZ76_010939 [Entomortierella beljakovae]